jgi:abortive infection bacteriophage resistance protein
MQYQKPALSLKDQALQLQQRGLVITDLQRVEHYLNHIGYYRLSAYCLTYAVPAIAGQPRSHQFQTGTTFEQILGLYIFDRKLRLLVMEAIERCEVAVRTGWAHAMSMRYGAHAHTDSTLFKKPWQHIQDLAKVAKDIDQSHETFVEHYRKNYTQPLLPPIWAIVETMSLGSLSRWFANTHGTDAKKEVSQSLGMPNIEVLEQVLHALTPVRNACAHHSRLWNRRFPIQLPAIKKYQTSLVAPNSPHHQAHYLYNYLTILALVMQKINPTGSWASRVSALITTELPLAQHASMGFPTDWAARPAWKDGKP